MTAQAGAKRILLFCPALLARRRFEVLGAMPNNRALDHVDHVLGNVGGVVRNPSQANSLRHFEFCKSLRRECRN